MIVKHFYIVETQTMALTQSDLKAYGIVRKGKELFMGSTKLTPQQARKILSEQPPAPGKSTAAEFEKLNAATQAFFYQLCEQIQSATHDASMMLGVKIGKDVPSIGLANAPRLSNLKKVGLIERGTRGWLQLTELGRAVFQATV
jgi:hypothetical protein